MKNKRTNESPGLDSEIITRYYNVIMYLYEHLPTTFTKTSISKICAYHNVPTTLSSKIKKLGWIEKRSEGVGIEWRWVIDKEKRPTREWAMTLYTAVVETAKLYHKKRKEAKGLGLPKAEQKKLEYAHSDIDYKVIIEEMLNGKLEKIYSEIADLHKIVDTKLNGRVGYFAKRKQKKKAKKLSRIKSKIAKLEEQIK